jgi:hypothetical protein
VGTFKNIALRVSEENRVAFTLGYASGNFQCQTEVFSRASLKPLKSLDLLIFFFVLYLRQLFLFCEKRVIFYKHFVRFISSKLQVQYVQCVNFRWLRGLRRRSVAARLLGSRIRIPLRSWMSVSRVCFGLSRYVAAFAKS